MSIPQLKREAYNYQAAYCEENIWHLCQQPSLKNSYVVFITSKGEAFPMLNQRASDHPLVPIYWDYHVVLLLEGETTHIVDFDTQLDFSTDLATYFKESFVDESLLLASSIQTKFTKDLKRKNRGVKQAGFVVLHQTYMPSVLIELGFLTNKNEGKFLNSKVGQQKMAKEIAKSITKYYHQLKANTVVVNQDKNRDESILNTSFSSETKIENEVIFKIQIASSKNKIKVKSYNFRGLKNVQRVKVGSYYKYYYGITSNYKEVKNALLKAKEKGYSDAYIAAFENGEKTPLSKVLK